MVLRRLFYETEADRSPVMDWKDVAKRLLSDPEVRAYYQELRSQYRIIGETTKQRQRCKMTQEQLAQRIGTTQSAVARIEAGKANLTIDTLERIAEALEYSLSFSLKPKKSQDEEGPHRRSHRSL